MTREMKLECSHLAFVKLSTRGPAGNKHNNNNNDASAEDQWRCSETDTGKGE